LLVAGALAPAAGISAQAEAGSVELRLLEAPSARRDDPRARIYIIDHIRPGESISRMIGVRNKSDEPVRIELYSGAAELVRGEFVASARNSDNDLATWTTVLPETVNVQPSDEAVATVRIAVPRDAAAGERYGAVWAQLPKATSKSGPSEVNRVGIRMYVSVGPGGEPASDFVIDSLVAQRGKDGTPRIVARLRNTGGRALDMTGSLRLTNGPGGLSAGPFPASLGSTLGLGQTGSVTVPLDKQIPDGPWDAKLSLRSGILERSASASIRFPRNEGASKPVRLDPPSSGLFGKLLVVLGVLFLLGLILWFFLRRRRRELRRVAPG
jgi:hypothetical protein